MISDAQKTATKDSEIRSDDVDERPALYVVPDEESALLHPRAAEALILAAKVQPS